MKPVFLIILCFSSLYCSGQVIDMGVSLEPDLNELKFKESDLKLFFSEIFENKKNDSYQYDRNDVKSVIIEGTWANANIDITTLEFFKYSSGGYENTKLLKKIRKKLTKDYASFLSKSGKNADHKFRYQLGVNVKTNELVYASVTSTEPLSKK